MSTGPSCSKAGKRKRSLTELEDIENSSAWLSDKSEAHPRKRVRESPPTSPPLTPITPNNQHSPSSSPRSLRPPPLSSVESRSGQMSPVSFINRNGLLDLMGKVDSRADVTRFYIQQHPGLQSRMRSVLLDWLMEVCEAYKMHRETYYLAMNYLDRYLSRTKNVAKTQLQLIGITCLFIAAKVEEIYPPKAAEFSYVTNETCTLDDMLSQELLILEILEWKINALTVNGWMSLLLQLWHNREAHPKSVMMPNHPVREYLETAQLVDLATLDEGCLRYTYLTIAAAAIHVMTDYKEVLHNLPVRVSNQEKDEMFDCVKWLLPFADAIRTRDISSPRKSTQCPTDYLKQAHNSDLKLLESVQDRMRCAEMLPLTPPPSEEKNSVFN